MSEPQEAPTDGLREQILTLGICTGPYDAPHRCSAMHCNHCGLCDVADAIMELVQQHVASQWQNEYIPFEKIDGKEYVPLAWLQTKLAGIGDKTL